MFWGVEKKGSFKKNRLGRLKKSRLPMKVAKTCQKNTVAKGVFIGVSFFFACRTKR